MLKSAFSVNGENRHYLQGHGLVGNSDDDDGTIRLPVTDPSAMMMDIHLAAIGIHYCIDTRVRLP